MRRAAIVLSAIAVTGLAGCGGSGAGPFAAPTGNHVGFKSPVKAGQTAAVTIVLPRTLTTPAVLLDVHPLHPQEADGITLRYAATTGMGLELAGQHGWNRPTWQEQPLAGFVIPAHHRGGVTIGEAAKRPGIHVVHGFVVDYRIGDRRYSAPQQVDVGLCVGYRICP
jgi:hypothetical protein